MHADEEIDIRDELRKGIQLAEQTIGFFQKRRDLRIGDAPFMIDGGRKKTPILVLLFIRAGFELTDIHRVFESTVVGIDRREFLCQMPAPKLI